VGGGGASSIYDGSISGNGHLTKVGIGKQVLNGNSTINGGTTVAGGSLIIGGAAGSSANLASDVDVAQGAMLGGHGTIIGDVSLASGATLNPGNSIGTLKVDGDLNFNSGSTLVIEADPDGRSDRVISTGTVSLGGANLSVLAGTGDWSPSTHYNIIQAASLNGTFGSISSNLAFLTPQVTYASNGVSLDLVRNTVAFTSVAQTYNQHAVARTLDAGTSGSLYNAVAVLSADQARSAYDSLSGEIHASTRSTLFDDSRYVRDAIGTRLRSAQSQAPSEGVLHIDADSGITFWVQGYGGWGDSDGNSNVADLDHNSQGMLLGIDMPLNDTWRAGLAAGYGNSDLDADARNSSANVDSTTLTAYLGGQWDALHLRVGASHAWNDIDSSRHVQVGSLGEHVKADYDASTSQVFGELGYAVQAGDVTLEPFIGLAHVEVESDSFSEHGGITALSSDSEKERATYSSLGLRTSTPAAVVAGVPVSVQSSLAWQHVLDEPTDNNHLTLAGYDSFTVKGVPVAQDTALVQFGVSAKLAPQASLDLGYSGQIGDGYSDHGVRLGLNISF
jgi:outer membrane autotransporter protein